jgi:hypothetical protein
MKQICIIILLASLFPSCGGEEGATSRAITFTATIVPPTRATTGVDFTSQFEAGDEIGVFAVSRDPGVTAALQSSNNLFNNLRFTYDGSVWTSDFEAYFPWGKEMDIYAYYPYDASHTNPLAITVSVPLDQRPGTAFSRADLMTATATDLDGSTIGGPVALLFTHELALVEAKILNPEHAGVAINDAKFKASLKGVQTGVTLDLGTGATVTTGDPVNVIFTRVEAPGSPTYTYRGLVPRQVKDAGTFLAFEQDMAINYTFQSVAPVTLEAGKAYPHEVTFIDL